MSRPTAPGLEETLAAFVERGARWIEAQRAAFRPAARPLPAAERERLSGFFSGRVLETARLARTGRIGNPGFLADFGRAGLPAPPDFTRMAGITFVDTVVVAEAGWPPSGPLLFHELVHVVQYGLLGVDEFTRRYVHGWAENGFRYETIPLERQAYELQGAFESSAGAAFSVEEAVRSRLGVP